MSNIEKALTSVTQVLSGYRSDFNLAGVAPNNGAVEEFLVFPALGMPRLLLPTKGPAMSTALRSFLGGHRWSGIVPSMIRLTSKTGANARLTRGVQLTSDTGEASPVRSLLAEVLGRNDFEMAFRMSVGRPNAKTVAMAITSGGDPLCFAKFGSEDLTNSLVRYEGEILTRFQGQDLPVVLPEVLRAGEWAGDHHVLVTKPLMIEPLGKRAPEAHRATDEFSVLNGVVSETLGTSEFWLNTVRRIDGLADDCATGQLLLAARDHIDQKWNSTTFDFGLAHGDWSRPNLGKLNDKVIALDWERCAESAPRGIDIAHFAIVENSSTSNRLLDLELIESHARHYLDEIGRSPITASALVTLDLLEMVLRFTEARTAGIPARDSTFGPALQAAILR